MEKQQVKSLKLNIHNSGVDTLFNTPEEIENFMSIEAEAWDWLNVDTSKPNEVRQILSHIYSSIFQSIETELLDVANSWEKESEDLESNIEAFHNLNAFIRFPFSNSELGRYIQDIKSEKGELVAALVLYLHCIKSYPSNSERVDSLLKNLCHPNNNGNFRNAITITPYAVTSASSLLTIFEVKESIPAVDSLKDFLNDAKKDVELNLENSRRLLTEQRLAFDIQHQEHKEADEKLRKQVVSKYREYRKRERTNRKANNNTALKELDKALSTTNAAKDTYLSQIELDSSITYWNKKETTHNESKNNWFKGLCGSVIFTLVSPFVMLWVSKLYEIPADSLIFGSINPFGVALTVLAISIGSFAIKFCSRQFATQEHLKLEAVERQTMLKTFLALMKEEKLKEQEDRKIALDTLFRPAQTGIVADYGAITPSDTIVKVFDKQVKKQS